jgi:hypothetical protein
MEQHKSEYLEFDIHKYYGKNAADVIKDLERQGIS